MIDVVRAIRNARAERNVEPGRFIQAVAFGRPTVEAGLKRQEEHVKLLARLDGLEFRPDSAERASQAVPLAAVRRGWRGCMPLSV